MHFGKRTVALALVLAMLLSVLPLQVFAEQADTSGQVVQTVETDCSAGHTPAESEEIPALCEDTGLTKGTYCSVCGITLTGRVEIPAQGHNIVQYEAKKPTYTKVGWDAYEACTRCGYTTYVEIPALGEASVTDYETFVMNLGLLEELAGLYVMENPGKDPVDLVIKYIRTGVERYNSGSWGIMAGYEDAGFAEFVSAMEDQVNATAGEGDELLTVTGMKNLGTIVLPNGQKTDLGHMFGTMDITYHNKFGVNHADVAGWSGDLVDLLEFADVSGASGSLEEMVQQVADRYFLVTPPEDQAGFNQLDFYGDMDGLAIMTMLEKGTYKGVEGYEQYPLTTILMSYFTEDLNDVQRADFFLRNRLGGVSTRGDIRDAVYNAYTGNKVIATLEGTREFQSSDLTTLRKAVCYAFADHICRLAGDYVEEVENPYYSVFSSTSSVLTPGITQKINYATSADGKQMVYYIATADITRDDVHVYANYKDADPSKGWGMSRVLDQANAAQQRYGDPESADYIENYNVITAINGAGFNMSTGEPGGLLVMGGVEYSPINSSGFFGILKDGTAVIGTTAEYNTIYKDQVMEGIAGFGAVLVKDGKIAVSPSASYTQNRASRTAVGITGTGKVVFMVLDGRQEPFSCGGSYEEIAQIMLEAGCVQAVNLDGGGSTTYVAKQTGDEALSVVSNPSDGTARSVSASLIMVSTAPSSTAFDHAVLEAPTDYMTVGSSLQLTPVGISPTGNTVALPEGLTWAVDNELWGTVTQDGVLTAHRTGTIQVYLMQGDQVVGNRAVEVVVPDNVYFTKSNVDTVYGSLLELPVKVLYNNKEVTVNTEDLQFALSNQQAGFMDGFTFVCIADESASVKSVKITASLTANPEVTAAVTVSLYKQGEITFDFDQASGGDRQLAWYRDVANATTDDGMTYTVVDKAKPMTTKYTLAIDMTQIPIPKRLEELTYMLPGADMEGASAWLFLLQLAERISPMTEITAQVVFDPNFDVDISGITLVNEYFVLTGATLDPETNVMTLKLNWIDQTMAIDPETANPMCIVNNLILTPKADAQWDSKSSLNVAHTGDISYAVYMRASALYSFSQKPENQATFGLYDYVNPNDPVDKGGYFKDTYKHFEDSYTLINALKNGWVNEVGGFAYYIEGVQQTGICLIDGYYYDFGVSGINVGQTKYTGPINVDGRNCYASFGKLVSGWQVIDGSYYYFDTVTFARVTGVKVIGGRTYTFNEDGQLVLGDFVQTAKGVRYYWAGRFLAARWFTTPSGTCWADNDGYVAYGNYPVIESARADPVWYHFDETTGARTGICDGFITRDGELYYCQEGQVFYGAVQTENGIVYCGSFGKVTRNAGCYIGDSLDVKAGLENGYYWCDADGYIQSDGFATIKGSTYYFNDYVRAKGFTRIGEQYYLFNTSSGRMYTDSTLWVGGSNPYGVPSGYYYFQADGTMYVPDPNGEKLIVSEGGKLYLTIDGVKQTNGLNELDGEYYYAAARTGVLAVNTTIWISSFNDLIAPGNGYFAFDGEGKLIKTGFVTGGGVTNYYDNLVRAKGLTKLGEHYYFFNASNGKMYTDTTMWVGSSNPYGLTSGYYYFQADGTMYVPDPNGEKLVVNEGGKLYFTIDGVKQTNGLNELDGEYYYAAARTGVLAANTTVWISKFNDLMAPGKGYFAFDGEGKLIKTGFVTGGGITYYYDNLVRATGLTKLGDSYYFFNASSGAMYTDTTLWIGGSNPYGLTSGYYYFQADGTMYVPDPNGEKLVVNEGGKLYMTIDGVKQTNGLNELDGEYYYAASNGVLAANTTLWISKFNDLMAPGKGYFAFDGEGKLIKTGFVTGGGITYYYDNLVRATGLTKLGENYYFFNASSGAMYTDTTLWIGGSNPYGLTSGYYYFQADGTMYVPDPNGEKLIVSEGGKLYMTIDGVKQTNGLNELDGEYYYAASNGVLATNTTLWISKFNDLMAPGKGYFAFDGEGKLIKTGFVTGGGITYYYDNLVRAKGLTKLGDSYYFFNASNGSMYTDTTLWIGGSNPYGLPSGYYRCGADGVIVIN